MAIKDLEARQGNVNLTLEIVEKGDIREFEKFGKKGRVCNAVAKDATGTIKITLWNEDIDKVNAGDTIKIENGWVGEWQGELQLCLVLWRYRSVDRGWCCARYPPANRSKDGRMAL